MNDWKERLGVVYSTNPDFAYENEGDDTPEQSLPKAKQKLRVALDKRNRGGKKVTIVADYKGPESEIEELGKILKVKCGVGGAVKDKEIIIQGDFRDRVVQLLQDMGYGARKL